MEATSYVACILSYFSHKCTSSYLDRYHFFVIEGHIFCWHIFCISMVNKCYSSLILMDVCKNIGSLCRLQWKCSETYTCNVSCIFVGWAYISNLKHMYTTAPVDIIDIIEFI